MNILIITNCFNCFLIISGLLHSSCFICQSLTACLSLRCTSPIREALRGGVCPSYGWRCWWGVSGAGVVVMVDGGWRSTSLRERDCLAREEPRRREECRSTRALSLRATFLLKGGKVGEDEEKIGTE